MDREYYVWKLSKLITKFELAIYQANNTEAVIIATEATTIGHKEPFLAKYFDVPNRFSKHGIHV